MLRFILRNICQGHLIPVGHFFRIENPAFPLSADVHIIQPEGVPLHINVNVRTHSTEHAFPVRLDLKGADRDTISLFAGLRRSAGGIPALLTGQPLGVQDRNLRAVHSRILVHLNTFLADFPVSPVTSLLKISQVNCVRIPLQPGISIEGMITKSQVLEIKAVQMAPAGLKLIPHSQEFHILVLCPLHVMLLHLIIGGKIFRQRRAVFPLRRIPDLFVGDQRITGV